MIIPIAPSFKKVSRRSLWLGQLVVSKYRVIFSMASRQEVRAVVSDVSGSDNGIFAFVS